MINRWTFCVSCRAVLRMREPLVVAIGVKCPYVTHDQMLWDEQSEELNKAANVQVIIMLHQGCYQ